MKSSKNNFGYLILGCGILLSALVLIFMTLTGIDYNVFIGKAQFSVYELLSYGDETRIGVVLAMAFVIAVLVFAVFIVALKLINVKFRFGGWLALLSAVVSLAAGVMFFCIKLLIGESDNSLVSLAIGAILCGIIAILNAFVLGAYAVMELKK